MFFSDLVDNQQVDLSERQSGKVGFGQFQQFRFFFGKLVDQNTSDEGRFIEGILDNP